MKVKKQWQGIHAYRLKNEPLEEAFAVAWQKFCEGKNPVEGERTNLDYLLDNEDVPPLISARDREVANTIIQWLGSPVGRWFVDDVMKKAR